MLLRSPTAWKDRLPRHYFGSFQDLKGFYSLSFTFRSCFPDSARNLIFAWKPFLNSSVICWLKRLTILKTSNSCAPLVYHVILCCLTFYYHQQEEARQHLRTPSGSLSQNTYRRVSGENHWDHRKSWLPHLHEEHRIVTNLGKINCFRDVEFQTSTSRCSANGKLGLEPMRNILS